MVERGSCKPTEGVCEYFVPPLLRVRYLRQIRGQTIRVYFLLAYFDIIRVCGYFFGTPDYFSFGCGLFIDIYFSPRT